MAEKTIDDETTKLTKGWKRTEDIQGHEPKFPVKCVRCRVSLNEDRDMELRHSVLRLSPNAQKEIFFKHNPPDEPWKPDEEEFDPDTNLNIMSYKCPHCAWFIRFYVQDAREYIQKLFKDRDFNIKFIPLWETDELTPEEEAKVLKQLEALGYWGGR